MKFLLLGNGKSVKSIIKFLKYHQQEYIQAVFSFEYTKNALLIDEGLFDFDFDFVFKSPGISSNQKIIKKLKNRFRFISEIDLLYLFNYKTKVIAISGSNGKTTCVEMITLLLKKANYNVISIGNSHEPITSIYKSINQYDYLVIELSSFQLEDMRYYHPYIAALTNLEPNHLDMVKSLSYYYKSKKKICLYMNKSEFFINNNLKIKAKNTNRIDVQNNYEILDLKNKDILRYKNAIAIVCEVANILNINQKYISMTLNEFKSLKYREEKTIVNNITFINDSKSTTVEATLFALNNLPQDKNIILIVGGKDKKLSYKKFKNIEVCSLIALGENRKKIKKYYKNAILSATLDSAFKIAVDMNYPNKIILFSPASSSFDQYKNYQSRGEHFKYLIKKYKDECYAKE